MKTDAQKIQSKDIFLKKRFSPIDIHIEYKCTKYALIKFSNQNFGNTKKLQILRNFSGVNAYQLLL